MTGRLVGYGKVSRDGVNTLDVTEALMACIFYLDISSSPAHLRYLIRRLRQKLSRGTPILVGLWPATGGALSDKVIQTSIGTDYLTTSLGQSVTSCVEAVRKVEMPAARQAAA